MKLIIANVLSAVSNLLYGTSSFFKKKKTIMITQVIDSTAGCLACLLADSYSAAVTLFICAVRNFLVSKDNKKKWIYWLFAGALLVLGLISNTRGFIGILPVAASVQYTLWAGYAKNEQSIRYGMVVNYIPWIIHNAYVKLYTSAIFMTFFMIFTIVNIVRFYKEKGVEMQKSERIKND